MKLKDLERELNEIDREIRVEDIVVETFVPHLRFSLGHGSLLGLVEQEFLRENDNVRTFSATFKYCSEPVTVMHLDFCTRSSIRDTLSEYVDYCKIPLSKSLKKLLKR
jgi:hypothetical protein